jgi:hypothetical protein
MRKRKAICGDVKEAPRKKISVPDRRNRVSRLLGIYRDPPCQNMQNPLFDGSSLPLELWEEVILRLPLGEILTMRRVCSTSPTKFL